ncbi:GntR family transcriptional regulator [Alkalihalobacillus sp. MEB130]|uniref:GntR family transcriptional regulator n=1 Tax=Alkalihalobacillus sp. MEB130 TaxID=2976704 RepID=UPI0028DE9ACE|nr:GntR family transcriptional regulator [Alkalihalobacillus sp. MEB130]MDT8861841.1 GntR family transcriptional regulator [Alkalihalobacillus sp. MEB130]
MSRPMENAYRFIKDKILDGTYMPSQKITETELSEIIGVSRNTVKKALLKLEQENLVNIESNKGAFIKSFTLEEVMNYLEIREVLEGVVARTAVKNINESELDKMEEILVMMGDHLKNNRFDAYSSLNKEFHNIIYQASKNIQAVEMISVIKNQLLRYHFRTILVPGRNTSSYEEHQNIFKAFKEQDEVAAEKYIRIHIANVRETVKNNFTYLI